MVVKRRVTKKKAAKKKVGAAKPDRVAILREKLKDAKAENAETTKKLRESQRQVAALLKLLESTQIATNKFIALRVKEAVKKFGIVTAPKKRRVTKKKVARSKALAKPSVMQPDSA